MRRLARARARAAQRRQRQHAAAGEADEEQDHRHRLALPRRHARVEAVDGDGTEEQQAADEDRRADPVEAVVEKSRLSDGASSGESAFGGREQFRRRRTGNRHDPGQRLRASRVRIGSGADCEDFHTVFEGDDRFLIHHRHGGDGLPEDLSVSKGGRNKGKQTHHDGKHGACRPSTHEVHA
ncbi:MAG: hypothetical protein QM783_16470 [Phycisphaerales bacterium]